MAKLHFFSESRIALQREIKKHPDLMELLAEHPIEEFEIRLAETAAYCNIILEGAYTPEDIDGICELCVKDLVAKRMPVCNIITSSGGLNPLKLH